MSDSDGTVVQASLGIGVAALIVVILLAAFTVLIFMGIIPFVVPITFSQGVVTPKVSAVGSLPSVAVAGSPYGSPAAASSTGSILLDSTKGLALFGNVVAPDPATFTAASIGTLTSGNTSAGGVKLGNGSVTAGGNVNCNSLVATGNVTGHAVQATYELDVGAGSVATGNYNPTAIKMFNGAITTTGIITTPGVDASGNIHANYLWADYALDVGANSSPNSGTTPRVLLYNGNVFSTGAPSPNYTFVPAS